MSSQVSDGNIYCVVRKKLVSATSEEIVRQNILNKMIGDLGFSLNGFAIERGLDQMPHLTVNGTTIPKRRADIIYFAQDIDPVHEYYPLLVIECKAIPLSQKMMRQVIGYNYYLMAYFIAVANQTQIQLGWKKPADPDYSFVDHLPNCQELRKLVITSR